MTAQMLKTAVFLLAGAVALIMLNLTRLARLSQRPVPIGLERGRLRACPDTPNCVGSENQLPPHRIPAFLPDGCDAAEAWRRLGEAVSENGGELVCDDGRYLHAVFRSGLFRFVDDFEARQEESGVIHVRSASRVGRSDLGVNRRRVERLRGSFAGVKQRAARAESYAGQRPR